MPLWERKEIQEVLHKQIEWKRASELRQREIDSLGHSGLNVAEIP